MEIKADVKVEDKLSTCLEEAFKKMAYSHAKNGIPLTQKEQDFLYSEFKGLIGE